MYLNKIHDFSHIFYFTYILKRKKWYLWHCVKFVLTVLNADALMTELTLLHKMGTGARHADTRTDGRTLISKTASLLCI